jgi:hypothetical protein
VVRFLTLMDSISSCDDSEMPFRSIHLLCTNPHAPQRDGQDGTDQATYLATCWQVAGACGLRSHLAQKAYPQTPHSTVSAAPSGSQPPSPTSTTPGHADTGDTHTLSGQLTGLWPMGHRLFVADSPRGFLQKAMRCLPRGACSTKSRSTNRLPPHRLRPLARTAYDAIGLPVVVIGLVAGHLSEGMSGDGGLAARAQAPQRQRRTLRHLELQVVAPALPHHATPHHTTKRPPSVLKPSSSSS